MGLVAPSRPSSRGVPELGHGVRATSTRLLVDGELDVDAWRAVGQWLGRITSAMSWWAADFVAWAPKDATIDVYGEAAELLGCARSTVQVLGSVARRVDPLNRRGELSFRHHFEVACLSHREQDRILEVAIQRGLSARQRRQLVQERRHGRNRRARAGLAPCPVCGSRVPVATLEGVGAVAGDGAR